MSATGSSAVIFGCSSPGVFPLRVSFPPETCRGLARWHLPCPSWEFAPHAPEARYKSDEGWPAAPRLPGSGPFPRGVCETRAVEEALRDHSRVEAQEKWQKTTIEILEWVMPVLLLLAFIWLGRSFSAIPAWVPFPGTILLVWGLHEWLRRRPIKMRKREKKDLQNRVD